MWRFPDFIGLPPNHRVMKFTMVTWDPPFEESPCRVEGTHLSPKKMVGKNKQETSGLFRCSGPTSSNTQRSATKRVAHLTAKGDLNGFPQFLVRSHFSENNFSWFKHVKNHVNFSWFINLSFCNVQELKFRSLSMAYILRIQMVHGMSDLL